MAPGRGAAIVANANPLANLAPLCDGDTRLRTDQGGFVKTIYALISIISVPFLFLNILGGITSGIWLAVLGQWGTLAAGFIVFLFGSLAAYLLLLPSMAMDGIGSAVISRGHNFLGYIFVVFGAVLTIAAIIYFEIVIFHFFGKRAAASGVIFPTWLWSYGVATGVWGYLASKEYGEINPSVFYAFASQISYVVLSICRILLNWSLQGSVMAMVIPLVFPLVMGIILAVTIAKE